MDKKMAMIILAALVVIFGAVAYVLVTGEDKQPGQHRRHTKSSHSADTHGAARDGNAANTGSYIAYTEDAIAATDDIKLLYFHASWCPQCRELEADIKARGVPDGVTIIKVDYDSNQALRKKYGVTLQTTVVRIDDNGNLVKKFVAYDDPSLGAVAEKLL